MKKSVLIILLAAVVLPFVLSSCKKKDATPPYIYILSEDRTMTVTDPFAPGSLVFPVRIAGTHKTNHDTTVLLYTKYIEPVKYITKEIFFVGVQVEDNSSMSEFIDVVSTLEDIRLTGDPAPDRLRRQTVETITYTATDEEGNTQTATRALNIRNISDAFVGSYETTRTSQYLDNSLVYNSSVSSDVSIPGRLRFPRVYYHFDDNEQLVNFRVNADIWSQNISTNYSEAIAYMGKSNADIHTPFFDDMTYDEGMTAIKNFERLRIDAQEYQDSLGNNNMFISGVTANDDLATPLSRIEYVGEGENKSIARIVLELNVTIDKDLPTQRVDRVTEIYTPR